MLRPRPRNSCNSTLSDSGMPGVGIGSPFTNAMSEAMSAGTYENITVFAPYTNLSKKEIAEHGKALGLDYSETYSCYKGGEKHCGKCGTCRERIQALKEAGVNDTTEYELGVEESLNSKF